MMQKISIPEGKIEFEKDDESFHVYSLEIEEEFRDKGFGSRLLRKLISFAKKSKIKEIKLDAVPFPDNNETTIQRLLSFYKKFGFKKVKNYYLGNRRKGETLVLKLK
jgi:ribosomal protein S18 acetylase RimI-like enzyme